MGRLVVALAICLCLSAASYGLNKQNRMEEKDTVVLLHTTEGNIKIKLYGNTPIHRDNFITHVKDGVYDSVLFHRVINEFMIQAHLREGVNSIFQGSAADLIKLSMNRIFSEIEQMQRF